MPGKWRPWGLIALAAAVFAIDRALKSSIVGASLVPGFDEAPVKFELFKNQGIAFSLGFGGPFVWVLSVLIILLAAYAAVVDFRRGRTERLAALAFFAFGAASNLYDRVVHGFVIDYLIFFGRSAVNLADAMIIAGAIWLVWPARKRSEPEQPGPLA